MQVVHGLRSRLNVHLRSKQIIVEPLEIEVVRTFLDVPDRSLRSIASVTHSTRRSWGWKSPNCAQVECSTCAMLWRWSHSEHFGS